MPERRILLSTDTEMRQEQVAAWLESQHGAEFVILAPTRKAADDWVRGICARTGGLMGTHRLTPGQLAGVLATLRLAEKGLAPLSGLGLEAVTARALHRCRREKELDYFQPVADAPGFVAAASRTLLELRLAGVAPEGVKALPRGGPDLARLLRFLGEELEAHGLADLAVLFQLGTEAAEAGESPLAACPVLLLDATPRFNLEGRFFKALASRSPSFLALVYPADRRGVKALEEALEVAGEVAGQDAEARGRARKSLERVRSYLFAGGEIPSEELDESLEFFSAPGEGRECVEIARRILQEAQRGVPFDRMAVLLRNPDLYQPQLEDALRRAGVAAFFSRGTVRPDPAGRAFLALLACASKGLSASRFAEYLSLGQVPDPETWTTALEEEPPWTPPTQEVEVSFKTAPSEGPASEEDEGEETAESPVISGTLRTPVYWERLLVNAAVIGGKERWVRRLDGLEQELRLKMEGAEEETRRRQLEEELVRLGYLKGFALPVIEFLDSLPAGALWGDWLEALRRLAVLTLRRPESVLASLAELEPMEAVGPVGLPEVEETLRERFRFLRRDPPAERYGCVFVGTPAEAAGRAFEVVFLPGLAEGIFPRKVLEDPLLLDEQRKVLSPELSLREDRLHKERLLLHAATVAARGQLVISYPRMDVVEGRARVPSLYALEILRAAEGKLPELQELENRAAEASRSRLGWPAPSRPEDAVDDAEFDLAVLDPLLHQSPENNQGAGRFLMEVNPCLARSLRGRFKRWLNRWSDADGLVSREAETLQILQAHRHCRRAYSPTALQHYAACPYRFFLNAIQRLSPREEVAALEQMDPLTRGSLFHRVQFELFRDLQGQGLLPFREDRRDEILERADEVLDRVAAEYAEDVAPAIPRVWESEIEDLRIDLRSWVREVLYHDADWTPIHFELSFGLSHDQGRDPGSTPEEVAVLDGVRLRGSIDLVERNRHRPVLRVTDHKTGRAPVKPPELVGGGEQLQPLLYGLAAEALLELPVEEGRLFFCTQRGQFQRVSLNLDEETRQSAHRVLESIDGAVAQGFLPAAPRKEACQYCDYRLVCGPLEELRTSRKPVLQDLRKIRETP